MQVVKGIDVRHATAEQIRAEVPRIAATRERTHRDADDPRRRGRAGDPRAAHGQPRRRRLRGRAAPPTRRRRRRCSGTRCPISCCSTGCCRASRGSRSRKELRADPRTRELPIIMVTARTDEADKVAGLEAWVDDYVTKPFSPARAEGADQGRAAAARARGRAGAARGRRAAARPGDAPRHRRRADGAARADRVPAAALLPRATRARALARAAPRPGLGRSRLHRGAHGRRPHPAAAPGARAVRPGPADRDRARAAATGSRCRAGERPRRVDCAR